MSFEKLQEVLLKGGDIGIPQAPEDPWIILDSENNTIGTGDSLESACKSLSPASTFAEVKIGDYFFYQDERWQKKDYSKAIKDNGDFWYFKQSDKL